MNPWLGLSSYNETNRLYGRDTEIVSLLDIIVSNPEITVIYGKSGIGKTSILRAGIFPKVRTMGFFPVYIRLDHSEENTDSYTSQVIGAVRREAEKSHLATVDLLGGNDDPEETLWQFFHRYKYQTMAGDTCMPVVFFDQFEELFTITGGNKTKVEDFLHDMSLLLNDIAPTASTSKHGDVETPNLASQPSFHQQSSLLSIDLDEEQTSTYSDTRLCRIAISIREDQLYHIEKISSTIPCLKRNRYFLQGLSHQGAIEVVTMPSPELVANDVAREIVAQCKNVDDEFVDPAFLSLVMYKLFERMQANGETTITLSLVKASVENIFSDYYRDSISGVSDKIVDFLEDKLVSKAGFRLSVPLGDVQAEGMTDEELNKLKNSRVVTLITRGNHTFIELTHDLLCAEVIKDKSEREKIKMARRNRRRMMIMGAIAAIVLAIAGLFAYQFIEIQEQKKNLEKAFADLNDLNKENERQKDELRHTTDSLNVVNEQVKASNEALNAKNDELAASRQRLEASNWVAEDNSTKWIATKALERINNGAGLNVLPALLERTPLDVNNPDKPISIELEQTLRKVYANQSCLLEGHTSEIKDFAFSPDNKYLISASKNRDDIRDVL